MDPNHKSPVAMRAETRNVRGYFVIKRVYHTGIRKPRPTQIVHRPQDYAKSNVKASYQAETMYNITEDVSAGGPADGSTRVLPEMTHAGCGYIPIGWRQLWQWCEPWDCGQDSPVDQLRGRGRAAPPRRAILPHTGPGLWLQFVLSHEDLALIPRATWVTLGFEASEWL
ncbi:hypothetical protein BJV74DRAFT_793477 [Russula compacta]|nr:hypothetical protein BJV74DRAFT_793477 [Russula compacta]